jgi:hypothetical protein
MKYEYEFVNDDIDFRARVVKDGDLYRIDANRFEGLKTELFGSVPDAKKRIFQCVVIRYDSEIGDAARRTKRLHEGRVGLKTSDIEKSLNAVNRGDLPF